MPGMLTYPGGLDAAVMDGDLARCHSRVRLGGLKIDRMTQAEFAGVMVADTRANAETGRRLAPKLSFSVNGNVLSLAASDPAYRAALEEADYLDADGQPLVFASRWLTHRPLPERVATTDFIHEAAAFAAEAEMRFFLLGGEEEVNARAAGVLATRYPGLTICGRHNGFFPREAEADLAAEIRESSTDVLWIGQGVPREHYLAVRLRPRLLGVSWIKTCGGLFDFLAERQPRAPLWMRQAGLEWAYRTYREPRRLMGRYARTNAHALWLMLTRSRQID